MKLLFYSITTLVFSLFLFSACRDNCTCTPPENQNITVDAGISLAVQLPVDSVTLHGTVLTGATAVMTYAWIQLSGPANSTIISSSTTETSVQDLVAGTYVFQFAATNSYGNTGIDTVIILVTTEAVHTLELQPGNNPTETVMVETLPANYTDPTSIEFIAEAWTHQGDIFNIRSMLQFDLSSIPAGATIVSAQLSLYVDSFPINGNFIDPTFGGLNQMFIGRIIEPWTNTTLWDNQPVTDAASQVLVPASSGSFEDLNFDVTSLVGPMVSGDNYGFKIYLQNEIIYNSRIYCSSKYPDATRHPKLVVIYY